MKKYIFIILICAMGIFFGFFQTADAQFSGNNSYLLFCDCSPMSTCSSLGMSCPLTSPSADFTDGTNFCTTYSYDGSNYSTPPAATGPVAPYRCTGNCNTFGYCTTSNCTTEACTPGFNFSAILGSTIYVNTTCASDSYYGPYSYVTATGELPVKCCSTGSPIDYYTCPSAATPAVGAAWTDNESETITINLTIGQDPIFTVPLHYWNAGDIGSILNVTGCTHELSGGIVSITLLECQEVDLTRTE